MRAGGNGCDGGSRIAGYQSQHTAPLCCPQSRGCPLSAANSSLQCSNTCLTVLWGTGDAQLDRARGWSCERVRSAAPGGASAPSPTCKVCASPIIRHSGRTWRAHASQRHAAHLVVRRMSHEPEIIPNAPVPADISTSITAQRFIMREGPAVRIAVRALANGGRLTELFARARLGQGETRLRRRQGAPTCDLDAPPRELDLLTCRPYNRGAHQGPRCDRSGAFHATCKRVDARRQAEHQGERKEHGGTGACA